MPDRIVLLRSGRNPFQIFMLSALTIIGVIGLIYPGTTATAVAHQLPVWQLMIWHAGLIMGGGISLGGVSVHGVMSLLIERVGLAILGCLTLGYAIVLGAESGSHGALSIGITAGLAVSCGWRIVVITRNVTRAEGATRRKLEGE